MTDSYWHSNSDPYHYPGSLVLKNLPDIRDEAALATFEQRATALRLDEVVEAIADAPIDLALWQTIHRILFQDVYVWAGEIRTVQLAKGDTVFAMPERITAEAAKIFTPLQKEDFSSMDRKVLLNRLSYYFGELNALHPFREGNGRTQKLLFDEVTRRIHYVIHWEEIETDALLAAVINAFQTQDHSLIEKLFDTAIKRS